MKKMMLPILLSFLFLTSTINAQVQKGQWISSAGIDVDINKGKSSSPSQTEKNNYLKVSLQQAYFLSDKFSLGIGTAFLRNKQNTIRSDDSYSEGKSNSIELYIYGQYYKRIKGNFYYSPQVSINYFKEKGRYEEKDPIFNPVVSSYKYNNYGIQLNPAQFSFRLTNKLLLESSLGYIIYGTRSGTRISPLETVEGSATALKMNFSPFISNIKISLLF